MINLGKIKKVEYRDFLISDFIRNNEPVILKNMIRELPTYNKWNLKYLREKIGNTSVTYQTSTTGIFPDIPNFGGISLNQKSTFKEFLNVLSRKTDSLSQDLWYFLSGDNSCIICDSKLNATYSALKDDISIPAFINPKLLEKVGIWLSKKSTISRIHFDSNGCHNLNLQIKGSKKVILFSPDEYEKMYFDPFKYNLSFFNFSNINLPKIPEKDFPLLKEVKYIEADLEEGDALFLPVFWIHHFTHTGNINVNVNFWWHPGQININPISIVWLLINASAQMISNKHALLSNSHVKHISKTYNPSCDIHLKEEDIMLFAKKLASVFASWKLGRPASAD